MNDNSLRLKPINGATTGNIPAISSAGASLSDAGVDIHQIGYSPRRFNPKHYGAHCDGINDDWAGVQQAVNNIAAYNTPYYNGSTPTKQSAGAELYIPETIVLSKPISVNMGFWHSKVVIRCAPQALIMAAAGFSERFLFKINSPSYKFSTETVGNPAAGYVRLNNATPSASTSIVMNLTDRYGNDLTNYISGLKTGQAFQVLDESNSMSVQHNWTVSGTPAIAGGLITIPVTYSTGSGSLTNDMKVAACSGNGHGDYPSVIFRDVTPCNSLNYSGSTPIITDPSYEVDMCWTMSAGVECDNVRPIWARDVIVPGPIYADNFTFKNCMMFDASDTGWLFNGDNTFAGDYFYAASCHGAKIGLFKLRGCKGAVIDSCGDVMQFSYCSGINIIGHHGEWCGTNAQYPMIKVINSVVKVNGSYLQQSTASGKNTIYIDDDPDFPMGTNLTVEDSHFEFFPTNSTAHGSPAATRQVCPSIFIDNILDTGSITLRNNRSTMHDGVLPHGNNGFTVGATDATLNTTCQNAARMFTGNAVLKYVSGVWKWLNSAAGDGIEITRVLSTPTLSGVTTGSLGNLSAGTYYYKAFLTDSSGSTVCSSSVNATLGASGGITFDVAASNFPVTVTVARSTASDFSANKYQASVVITTPTTKLYDMGGSLSGFAWVSGHPTFPSSNTTQTRLTYADGMPVTGTVAPNLDTAKTIYVDGTNGTDDAAHGSGSGSSACKTFQYAWNSVPDIAPLMDVTIHLAGEVGPVILSAKTLKSVLTTGAYSVDYTALAVSGTPTASSFYCAGLTGASIHSLKDKIIALTGTGSPSTIVIADNSGGFITPAGDMATAVNTSTTVEVRTQTATIDAAGGTGIANYLLCPLTIEWLSITNCAYGVYTYRSAQYEPTIQYCNIVPNDNGTAVYTVPSIRTIFKYSAAHGGTNTIGINGSCNLISSFLHDFTTGTGIVASDARDSVWIKASRLDTMATGINITDAALTVKSTPSLMYIVNCGSAGVATSGSARCLNTLGITMSGNAANYVDTKIPTSGTYTPTLTNVANLDSTTAYKCQYTRVGDVVTVSGKVGIDPTIAGVTRVGISLPIASNLAAQEDCAGAAFCPTIAYQGAAILADFTNDRAEMKWVAVDTNNVSMFFTFTYVVL